jgi:hypothetical protein
MTRNEFQRYLWEHVINCISHAEIDALVDDWCRHPRHPFADTGPALERMLAAGASKDDICRVIRYAYFHAVGKVLYMLGDPGIDNDDYQFLFEGFGSADPSGQDARPGSWTPPKE